MKSSKTKPYIQATGHWSLHWTEVRHRPGPYQAMTYPLSSVLALEEGIPITDPAFYASESDCPAELLRHIFRPAPQSSETIPLFEDRVKVLREVGAILVSVRSLTSSTLLDIDPLTEIQWIFPEVH